MKLLSRTNELYKPVQNALVRAKVLLYDSKIGKKVDGYVNTTNNSPCFSEVPPYLLVFLQNYLPFSRQLIRTIRGHPLEKWPEQVISSLALKGFDDRAIRARELEYIGLEIKQSTIRGIGEGVFVAKKFNEGDRICYFYGHIVSSDLHRRAERRIVQYGVPDIS